MFDDSCKVGMRSPRYARDDEGSAPGVIRLYPAGANTQPTDTCPLLGTLTGVLRKGSKGCLETFGQITR
jgi:hypothetical protein